MGVDYLVDTSMLYGEPLRLDANASNSRVELSRLGRALREARWFAWRIAWRPLHKLDGFRNAGWNGLGLRLREY